MNHKQGAWKKIMRMSLLKLQISVQEDLGFQVVSGCTLDNSAADLIDVTCLSLCLMLQGPHLLKLKSTYAVSERL